MYMFVKWTRTVSCGLALVLIFLTAACSGSGGGDKIVNSAEALKEYLDKQPANSPDKPIRVAMNANDLAFEEITAAINSSGKYVNLDLFRSSITTIPQFAFFDLYTEEGCTGLTGIILPNSVTSIELGAFAGCTGLTSITIPDKRKMTHFTQLQG